MAFWRIICGCVNCLLTHLHGWLGVVYVELQKLLFCVIMPSNSEAMLQVFSHLSVFQKPTFHIQLS